MEGDKREEEPKNERLRRKLKQSGIVIQRRDEMEAALLDRAKTKNKIIKKVLNNKVETLKKDRKKDMEEGLGVTARYPEPKPEKEKLVPQYTVPTNIEEAQDQLNKQSKKNLDRDFN